MPTPDAPKREILLKESRIQTVSEAVFAELAASDLFAYLIRTGVASLVKTKEAPFGVRTFAQVGQALLESGTCLVVQEKVKGSLLGLLHWALPDDVREMELPSSVETDNPILDIFAVNFLNHLGSYLRHGRLKEYRRKLEQSPFPRGRIDIRATTKLFSRGHRGRLAFQSSDLSADLLPNRLLALGLIAVDVFGATTPSRLDLRSRAQIYSPLFEDVDWYGLSRSPNAVLSRKFDEALSDKRVSGELRKSLAYAKALILHLGAWPDTPEDIIPRSYFLNLQTLFEDAILQVFRETISGHGVSKGRAHDRPIFPAMTERYIADPDVVVGGEKRVLLVADAKYKELEDYPDHSDIYQLLAHCQALGCARGLLIFPGEDFAHSEIGETRQNTEIWMASVRPSKLDEDLAAVWEETQATLAKGAAHKDAG